MTNDSDLKLDVQDVLTRAGEQALEQLMQSDPRRRFQVPAIDDVSDAQSAQVAAVEQVLVTGLQTLTAGAYVLSDQGRAFGRSAPKTSGRWWIVPISGAQAFFRGQVAFSMAVAWVEHDQIKQAWAYNPITKAQVHVDLGGRLTLNGFSSRPSGWLHLEGAFFHLGYPAQPNKDFSYSAGELERWGVQCYRSDDLIGDAIQLASGGIDGMIDYQASFAQSAIALHIGNASGAVCSEHAAVLPLSDCAHTIAFQPQIADEVVSRLRLPSQII